ncbi:Six-hairpin glycosidase-like protein, partial [Flagelloscypha sp. PMI_526]
SWELGVLNQILVEHSTPSLSVFTPGSIPPKLSSLGKDTSALDPLFNATTVHINWLREQNGGKIPQNTAQSLWIDDGSAGDPASFAPGLLLFDAIGWGGKDDAYIHAASNQLKVLQEDTPKTDDGAISHRRRELQLWADNCYMVPPFFAYYGVLKNRKDLVQESLKQLRLYRQYLRDPSKSNLWKHVLMGGTEVPPDEGHWATGNGWAALGMLRVMATIKHSDFANDFEGQISEMAGWVSEVLGGMVEALPDNNIFNNYLTIPPDAHHEGNFPDTASTALFAYAAYRLSVLMNDHTYIPYAERIRKTLSSPGDKGSEYKYFDKEGYLLNVVNPRSYGVAGEKSPEGQAFVLGMQIARREWISKGSQYPDGEDAPKGFIQMSNMAILMMASQALP